MDGGRVAEQHPSRHYLRHQSSLSLSLFRSVGIEGSYFRVRLQVRPLGGARLPCGGIRSFAEGQQKAMRFTCITEGDG
jgi:hypothetical protein